MKRFIKETRISSTLNYGIERLDQGKDNLSRINYFGEIYGFNKVI